MCRFVLYLGDDITLGSLVTEPANSIIHQSHHSHEREELVFLLTTLFREPYLEGRSWTIGGTAVT